MFTVSFGFGTSMTLLSPLTFTVSLLPVIRIVSLLAVTEMVSLLAVRL